MKPSTFHRLFRKAGPAAFIAAAVLAAQAADFKIVAPRPGGISPTPDIISQFLANGQLQLNWNGFAGPYEVQGRAAVDHGEWSTLATPTGQSATVSPGDSVVFRIRGTAPLFGSADACADCHAETHGNWMNTIHAGALNTLKAIGQGANAACLQCHTVGFGTPNGFKSEAITPYFAGVQCESCHGPAARHMDAPEDVSLRPVTTDSSKLCGGCHNGFHHPTYDEWNTAGHSRVTPTVANYVRDPNSGRARMDACGACHSGAVRMAMMKTVKGRPMEYPDGETAATTAITCAVCHDAHKPNLDNTHSLRNPRYSTSYFSYNTGTNTNFRTQWEQGGKDVQICGQCHNSRGAKPSDTSRPPHHSPQYNVLIGDVGAGLGYIAAATPAQQSAHRNIANQCTECHTHRHESDPATEENPVYTGHGFEPSLESCVQCHQTKERAESLVAGTQTDIKARIQSVKGLLDSWAATKSREPLRTKYGALAWEFNTAGQISNPTGLSTIKGPTSSEQSEVPADIKNARYYLYLVEHDGSYGVHNGKYARYLLDTAKAKVEALLAQP